MESRDQKCKISKVKKYDFSNSNLKKKRFVKISERLTCQLTFPLTFNFLLNVLKTTYFLTFQYIFPENKQQYSEEY